MTEPTANPRLDGIAQTAAQLFLDKGYDAASMADLAAATGLGKSSLYHHLESKDQLLAYICGRPLTAFRRERTAATTGSGTARFRLATVLAAITRICLDDVAATALVFNVKPTTDAALKVIEERRALELMLADVVAAAQEEGTARTDVEPLLLTRLVIGSLNGLMAWYRPEATDFDHDTIGEAVLALMLSAIHPVPSAG